MTNNAISDTDNNPSLYPRNLYLRGVVACENEMVDERDVLIPIATYFVSVEDYRVLRNISCSMKHCNAFFTRTKLLIYGHNHMKEILLINLLLKMYGKTAFEINCK